MSHVLCSCGAIITSQHLLDHKRANLGHYEVRRWTFPVKKDVEKLKELKIEKKRLIIERTKQTHQYTKVIFGVSRCHVCGVILTKENMIPSYVKVRNYKCKSCAREYMRRYRKTRQLQVIDDYIHAKMAPRNVMEVNE